MRFAKRGLGAATLVSAGLSWSGCAGLNAPFLLVAMLLSFVFQLVWFAISLPIRLLPLAIKYAPLALFFVEGTPETPLYLAMADRVVFEDVGSDMPMTCFRFTLEADQIPHLGIQEGKLLLLDRSRNVPREALPQVWNALQTKPGAVWVERALARRLRREHRLAWRSLPPARRTRRRGA